MRIAARTARTARSVPSPVPHRPLHHGPSPLTSAVLVLLVVAPPAWSQATAVASPPAQAAVGSADPAAADALPDVTVTARKRAESAQDVPISLTVLRAPAQSAQAAPADGNGGIARAAPNVSFADSGGQFGNLFLIRGVGSFAPLSPDDTSVATYLGEVPRSVYGGPPVLLDVDRVEVLRGPQGTLFGRNTQGGAIDVIPNAPSFKPAFSATAETGTRGHRLGEVVANTPLSPTLAARLAVQYTHLDGSVPNVATGGHDGRVQVGAARGSLRWLLGERTTVTASAFHDARRSDAARFLWLQNPLFPQSAVNPQNDVRWRDTGASLKVEHDFDAARLTSLTSYQRDRSRQPLDLTDSLIYGAMTHRPRALFDVPYADFSDLHFREHTFQQELRASSTGDGRLAWTVGGNYLRSRFANDTTATASPAAFNFQAQNGTQASRIASDSAALFGEGTLRLAERLKATAGLRYSHEQKDADYRFTGNGNPATVAFSSQAQRLSEHFLTGRAGLSYDFTPAAMCYATVSRGVVGAGFPALQTNGPAGKAEAPFPRSTSWTYEAGFKSQWLQQRLGLNGAVFFNDVQNGHLIVFDPTRAAFGTAALAYRSKGAELEASAALGSHVKATAGLGYTLADLVDVPAASATGARTGNRVPNMARATGTLGLQYESPLALDIAGGNAQGRFKAAVAWQGVGRRSADVRQSFWLPGYGVLNARIGWQQGHWELYAFGWNLLDKRYLVAGQAWGPGVASVRVGQPRVLGLGATVRF